ncbi:hypothetical protein [Haploplasma axanthum]|uniref:Uncharacterized protein n=1 Tax=Haploplasma axanthum TaxID=29552 RepID=A0A449BC41_HAPAX|nr:hypothetical protein [Haploplasma axanthum]VEU79880.1 Uncharacterised protein [Haploplasma axanthum]
MKMIEKNRKEIKKFVKNIYVFLVVIILFFLSFDTEIVYSFIGFDIKKNQMFISSFEVLLFYMFFWVSIVSIPKIIKINDMDSTLSLFSIIIFFLVVVQKLFHLDRAMNIKDFLVLLLSVIFLYYNFKVLIRCKIQFNIIRWFEFLIIIILLFPSILFHRTSLVPFENGMPVMESSDLINKVTMLSPIYFLMILTTFILCRIIWLYRENIMYNFEFCFTITLSLIVSSLLRKATIIHNNSFLFFFLPDSPCGLSSYLMIIAIILENKLANKFVAYINFPLMVLNVLILYTGKNSNFFTYLTFDTIVFHVIGSSICFIFFLKEAMIYRIEKESTYKILVINSLILLFYVLVGTIQEYIEYKTKIDLLTGEFYGYGYANLPVIGNVTNNKQLNYVINFGLLNLFFLILLIIMDKISRITRFFLIKKIYLMKFQYLE